MSLAPPPPLRNLPAAFRRDGVLVAAGRLPSISGCFTHRRSLSSCGGGGGGSGGAYCLFSGGSKLKKQDEARKALENALGQKKTEFQKWGVQVERRRQKGQPGGPAAGGGGSSGGGGWFRWLASGDFWDAAKQTALTILGIIAAFFLIANFNALMAAIINSLLVVLRQIRRALSFVAQCVFQGASAPRSGPKSSNPDSGNVAGVPVKDPVRMSAKERVVRKWGMD